MNYFQNFKSIEYPFQNPDGSLTYRTMLDITTNARFINEVLSKITLYEEYQIQDGDTPEIIAHRIYGDQTLHWIVMLTNLRFSFWEDFPLSNQELYDMCVRKYGENNLEAPKMINDIEVYIDSQGNIVDLPISGTASRLKLLTNFDYEVMQNDKKRTIKLVHPSFIDQIVKEFQQRVKYG